MAFKNYINRFGIRKKMILSCYAVVTPILLVISAIMLVTNYHTTREEIMTRGESRVQNLEANLEEMNNSVSEISTYICINNDILTILNSNDAEEKNKNSQLWLDEAPLRFIQDTIAIKGYIKTIGIYPENGIHPYLRCMDSSSYLPDIESVRTTEAYQTALARKGKKCWMRVEKSVSDIYWANQSPKIVMYREIFDLTKKTPLGYLVIGADAERYQNLCDASVEQEGEGIMILSLENEKLLSSGMDDFEEEFMEWAEKQELEKKDHQILSYNNYFVFFKKASESGQSAFLLIPGSHVTEKLRTIAYTPLLMMLGVLLGLYPVLLFVSNVVIKPLGKVNKAMNEFKQGDFTQSVEVESHDEVGEVAEVFNQMVKDIRSLIDEKYVMEIKEKESELNALQAQINPHFLYNALDSLYWQAVDAENEEIAENILALSNLFRQVLGKGKSTTTVAQELNLVREYLKVQKMRFQRKLLYNIEMDDAVKDRIIPKLIIQPFVENAVVHGFENNSAACTVNVKAAAIEGGVEFVIADTGIGMDEEQVKMMLGLMDEEKYRGQRIGRYAVKNVRERLDLMYKQNYQMKVESAPGQGTKITIDIFSEEDTETEKR